MVKTSLYADLDEMIQAKPSRPIPLLLIVTLMLLGCSAEELLDPLPEPATTTDITVTVPFPTNAAAISALKLSILDGTTYLVQDLDLTQTISKGWQSNHTIPLTSKTLYLVANGYDVTNTLIYTGTTISDRSGSLSISLHAPAPLPTGSDWLLYDGTKDLSLAASSLWQDGHTASISLDNTHGLFFWPDSINGQTKAQAIQLNNDNTLTLGNVFSFPRDLFDDDLYLGRGIAQLDSSHIILSGIGSGFGTPNYQRPTLKIVDIDGLTLSDSSLASDEFVPSNLTTLSSRKSHNIVTIDSEQLLSVFDSGYNNIGVTLLSWDGRIITLLDEIEIVTPNPIKGPIVITKLDNSRALVGWIEQLPLESTDIISAESSSTATSAIMARTVKVMGDGSLVLGESTQLLQAATQNHIQDGFRLKRISDSSALLVAGESSDRWKVAENGWVQIITATDLILNPTTPQQLGTMSHWITQIALEIFDARYVFLTTEGVEPNREPPNYRLHTTFEVTNGAIGPLNITPIYGIDATDAQSLQFSQSRVVLLQASEQQLNNGYYLVQP